MKNLAISFMIVLVVVAFAILLAEEATAPPEIYLEPNRKMVSINVTGAGERRIFVTTRPMKVDEVPEMYTIQSFPPGRIWTIHER